MTTNNPPQWYAAEHAASELLAAEQEAELEKMRDNIAAHLKTINDIGQCDGCVLTWNRAGWGNLEGQHLYYAAVMSGGAWYTTSTVPDDKVKRTSLDMATYLAALGIAPNEIGITRP